MSANKKLFGVGLAALSMGAALSTGVAYAQDASAPQASAAPTDEIVVTARRREESAQSVPVAVSVFSPEQLEQRSVVSLEDLTRVTPGLRYASEGGGQNTTISLRGLSKIPVGDGTAAVVTYFADVPLASNGSNLPTFDLASVQVLKGPQGTLFGRNTIGGAVLVTPVAPSHEFGGYVSGSIGEYNLRTVEGAVNLPLGDDVALRLAGQSRQQDGFVENIGTGPDLGDTDQYSLRASLLIEPTSSFRNTLIVDYFRGNEAPAPTNLYGVTGIPLGALDGALPFFDLFDPDFNVQTAAALADGPRTINTDAAGQAHERELYGITNRTSFDFSPDVTLTNIFGYRATHILYHSDIDSMPALTAPNVFDASLLGLPFGPGEAFLNELILLNPGQVLNTEQFTEELQLAGSSFNNQLSWIVGAFYAKEQPNGTNGSFFQQFDLIVNVVAPNGLGLPVGTQIHLNPPQVSVNHTETESRAIYGQVGLDLSSWLLDGLTLNLGYRYTWDDIDVCGGNFSNGNFMGVGGAYTTRDATFLSYAECRAAGDDSPTDGRGVASTQSEAPTWTIGLDYQITPDVFTYITSRRGYRQAGINAPIFETPCTTLVGVCTDPTTGAPAPGIDLRPLQFTEPEEVTDVEIGVKSRWGFGGVTGLFNLSAFTMEYKDALQFLNVTGAIPSGDPAFPSRGSVGVNAADLTIQGAELETSITPIDSLTLMLSAAYTDQQVDSVATVPSGFPSPLTPASVTLPTPELSGTFGFRWTLPLRPLDGELAFSGDYFWTDEWQAQGAPLPGYEVANFRLDWDDINNRPLKASLFITNAFDEDYIISPSVAISAFPMNTGMFGPPRVVGAQLTYRFGE